MQAFNGYESEDHQTYKKHALEKRVVGHEGRYEVSNMGRVRSVTRRVRLHAKGAETTRLVTSRILKNGMSRGYPIVNLSGHGTVAVHLLVAKAFLNPYKEQVNHIDGVKHNNQLDNLEWVTRSENQRHTINMGRHSQAKRICGVNAQGERVYYPSASEAAHCINGKRTSGTAISKCLRGQRKTALGYRWHHA